MIWARFSVYGMGCFQLHISVAQISPECYEMLVLFCATFLVILHFEAPWQNKRLQILTFRKRNIAEWWQLCTRKVGFCSKAPRSYIYEICKNPCLASWRCSQFRLFTNEGNNLAFPAHYQPVGSVQVEENTCSMSAPRPDLRTELRRVSAYTCSTRNSPKKIFSRVHK